MLADCQSDAAAAAHMLHMPFTLKFYETISTAGSHDFSGVRVFGSGVPVDWG